MCGFVRSLAPLSTDHPMMHLAVLAYMSDEHQLGLALLASPKAVGPRIRNVVLATSTNHSISRHDSKARADEWMLVERGTTWGEDGRVLVWQKLWNIKTGKLVMSGVQEGLVRLRSPKL